MVRLPSWAESWHKPAFIAFLVVWLLNWVTLLLGLELPREGRWIEALLPWSATLTTLLGWARRLPLQNVLTAASIIAVISTGVTAIGAYSGVPFGPIFYTGAMGDPLLGEVPWPVPLMWIVIVLNGRGVARLVMRPWRKTRYYGFWLIGITCLLVVLFDVGFEPFAVYVKGYWLWFGRSAFSWYSTPLANFLGWLVAALGMVIFTIPWMINKQPVKQPRDYHPLAIWLLLNLWVLTGIAGEQLWFAVGVSAAGNVAAALYAVRSARW